MGEEEAARFRERGGSREGGAASAGGSRSPHQNSWVLERPGKWTQRGRQARGTLFGASSFNSMSFVFRSGDVFRDIAGFWTSGGGPPFSRPLSCPVLSSAIHSAHRSELDLGGSLSGTASGMCRTGWTQRIWE